MKHTATVLVLSVLLLASANANFYGKRGSGHNTLQELLTEAKEARRNPGADRVLEQIYMLIRSYRDQMEIPRADDLDN